MPASIAPRAAAPRKRSFASTARPTVNGPETAKLSATMMTRKARMAGSDQA